MNVIALLGGVRATLFAALALLALTWSFVQTSRLHYLEARHAKMLVDFAKAKTEAELRAQVATEELNRLRNSAPKAGASVREIVRERPSDCRVPAASGLRDAVRASNAARGADPAVPGDA